MRRFACVLVLLVVGAGSGSATAQLPPPELCNGLDDDGDGLMDEDFDVDEDGVTSCGPDGTDGTADDDCDDTLPAVHPGHAELCDLLDNDCNGWVDEAFPLLGAACTVGLGACQRTGTFVCAASQLAVVCNMVPGLPTRELCATGIDEDCDGVVDEFTDRTLMAGADDNAVVFVAEFDPATSAFVDYRTLGDAGTSRSRAVALGDIDGDGIEDLVVAAWSTSASTLRLHLLTNDGCGAFAYGREIAAFPAEQYQAGLVAGDLDLDGDVDLVAGAVANELLVLLNDGRGGFVHLPVTGLGSTSRCLDLGDFNQDGVLDLVRSRADGYVETLLGIGDGRFGVPVPLDRQGSLETHGVVAGDLDGDGHDDVLGAYSSVGDISFWAGRGDGTFAPRQPATAGVPGHGLDLNSAADFDAFDYDQDGDLDVVFAHVSQNRLLFFRNQGDGTFAAGVSIGSTTANVMGVSAPLAPPPPDAPTAGIDPLQQVVLPGASFTLDGRSSQGAIEASWWDFDDGSPPVATDPPGPPGVVTHGYLEEGLYTPTLEVYGGGWSNFATASVAAVGEPPAITVLAATYGEDDATGGVWPLVLDGAQFAGDDFEIVDWQWEIDAPYGDGFEDGTATDWQVLTGNWTVSAVAPLTGSFSYQQNLTTAGTVYRSLLQGAFAGDQRIAVDLTMLHANEQAGLLFGARDADFGYELLLQGGSLQSLLLRKRSAGTVTTLLTAELPALHPSYPLDTGKRVHLEVARRGSAITVWLDGVKTLEHTDATFPDGRIGLIAVGTSVRFDDVRVQRVASGEHPAVLFTQPGTRPVRLTVEDRVGQQDSEVLQLTTARGSYPFAWAGGPYTATEDNGFVVTLDGFRSSDWPDDPNGLRLTYLWDLGTETFDGTAIDLQKWITKGNVSQNGALILLGTGIAGANSAFSRDRYLRNEGLTFEARVRPYQAMVGWKDSTDTTTNAAFRHGLLFTSSGNVEVWESNVNRGPVAKYTVNTWYNVRIELKQTAGARYFLKPVAASEWLLVHDSTSGTDTQLRQGLDVYSGTLQVDDLHRHAAGRVTEAAVYGVGSRTVSLTVVDPVGQQDTDQALVTISPSTPPVALAQACHLGLCHTEPFTVDETGANDGTWAFSFDGSGSTDGSGTILLYEWDFSYDSAVGFVREATGITASRTFDQPGNHVVVLRVTDLALQTAMDAILVSIVPGLPPVAVPGGPYAFDEFSGKVYNGGFTVTVYGSDSTDDQSQSSLDYRWHFGTDTFAGATLDRYKWQAASTGIVQSDGLAITGASVAGTRYAYTTNPLPRAEGLTFQATVKITAGATAYLGFKQESVSGSFAHYPHALAFSGGSILIYENGNNRGNMGYPTVAGQLYDVRIEEKAGDGARYFIRPHGEAEWTLLYDSLYLGTAYAWLHRGFDVLSGTLTVTAYEEWATGVQPTYTLYGMATRPVTLYVTDRALQVGSASTTLTTLGNAPPFTTAGPDLTLGEEAEREGGWLILFDGSSDDYKLWGCDWDFEYDGTFDPTLIQAAARVQHRYLTPGTRQVMVRCADHTLRTVEDTATIMLTEGEPPVAHAGADKVTEGIWPVVLDGAGSTDDVEIARYEWDFGDGRQGTGPTPSHTYWATGVYTATLTVTDHTGRFATDTATVTVQEIASAQPAPVADAGGPYAAGAGGPPAYFEGRGSRDDFGIVKYLWDVDATVDSDEDGIFDNDADEVGRRPFWTYAAAGQYTATLTVVDGSGHAAKSTATVNVAANQPPHVICVPASAADPTARHGIVNGRATRLKAIVRDAGSVYVSWDYGDGTPPTAFGSVANKDILETSLTYPPSPAGTLFNARVTVKDANGATGSCEYRLVVAPDDLDTRTNVAIGEGLWFLHRTRNRTSGGWLYDSNWWAASTASSVQAFLIQGHLEDGDHTTNPFVEDVNQGLRTLMTRLLSFALTPQYYGDPDSDGNGLGVRVNEAKNAYQGGMVLDALVATGRPLGFAVTGGAGVKGRYYHQLATDLVDAYSWGQTDAGTPWAKQGGGWRYELESPNADNSACQWWAIGARAAEDTWHITTPRWVKDRNLVWLDYSYNGIGWGYQYPGNEIATTPSGLVQLSFDGVPTWDSRWRNAEDYLATHWLWQRHDYYALFALVKSLRLAVPDPVHTLTATGLDWYNHPDVGVRRAITDDMVAIGTAWGSWHKGSYGGPTFHTPWAVIMLTPTLFVMPPVADAGRDLNWAYDLPVEFDASGSFHNDPHHAIVKYEWDFDYDPANPGWDLVTSDPQDPAAVYTYPDPHPGVAGDAPRTVIARLRVTDDQTPPQTDLDERVLVIAEPPHAPFARFSVPPVTTAGLPFTLNASASLDIDPGDAISRYEWDLDNDGVFFANDDDVDWATTEAISGWTYDVPGTYLIGLRVWDHGQFNPLGCTWCADCTPGVDCPAEISCCESLVSEPEFHELLVKLNEPPLAEAGGPYVVDEGASVELDGGGSTDPNGDPLTFAWDLDLDGIYEAEGVTVSASWSQDGDEVVGLLVDDGLLDAVDFADVVVLNAPPAIDPVGDPVVAAGLDGQVVAFTDPGVWDRHDLEEGAGTAVEWVPGEGFTTAGVVLEDQAGEAGGLLRLTRTWPAAGTFPVTVRVCDDSADCALATFHVTVVCGAAGLGAPCAYGVGECLQTGELICDLDTGELVCSVGPGQPAIEVCNGLDDDCDGQVDEDLGTTTCGTGACEVTVDACADGVPQTCVPGQPGAEACNLVDDDCDGQVDEDLGTTTCGTGACEVTVDACADGVLQACVPGQPVSETCDLIDNDCDGAIDEDLGTTTCGLGACAVVVDNCVDGIAPDCVPGLPGVEICNGLDDDCDGQADEDGVCFPEVFDDTWWTSEGQGGPIDVLANDSDPLGVGLVIIEVTQGSLGTVLIEDGGNSVSYWPFPEVYGEDWFSYTVTNGSGGTATAGVHVSIMALPDPPVVADDEATTPEDTAVAIDVLANDSDPDGDLEPPTLQVQEQPAAGMAFVDTELYWIVYVPDPDAFGTDGFTYQVCDMTPLCGSASVQVTVEAVNDEPLAEGGALTVDEDEVASGTLVATDPDGDPLTFTVVTGPEHGTLAVDPGGSYAYTPDRDYNGPDSFTFQASDGSGSADEATVTISVNPVNDAPVAADGTLTVAEDEAASGTLAATDVDRDALAFFVAASPAHGTLALDPAGAFTYTPETNYNGPDSFTFVANDGTADSNAATVTITVTPVNDVPVAADGSVTVDEDTSATMTLVATDVDEDPLTYALVKLPEHGTVTLDGPVVTYTPDTNYNGPDSFTFQASDASTTSNLATVTISVTAVNDVPVAANGTLTVDEDEAASGTLAALDVDGDALTFSVVAGPAHGTLALGPGAAYTYTPETNYNGPDSFTFVANDGTADSNAATVTISVTPVNDEPLAEGGALTVDEDEVASGTLVATDPDGDPLTFTVVTGPEHGTLAVDPDGSYAYTPDRDYNGPDSFTFQASDGSGSADEATVTISVNPVNDAPVAASGSLAVDEDEAASGTLAATDVDRDALAFFVAASPAHGTLALDPAGAFTYTPETNYNGPDSFTFVANDGTADSNAATVTITVTPVNDVPVAADGSVTVDEDTSATMTLVATDVDEDPLTYALVKLPEHGTVTLDGPVVTYTPDTNYNGPDSFTFQASDGSGSADEATVTISVNPVNDAPVAADDAAVTEEDLAVLLFPLANDGDLDNDLLFVAWTSAPASGSAAVNLDGTITYVPAPDFHGLDLFQYGVIDPSGALAVATVMVTVLPVNDAPVGFGDAAETLEDVAVTVDVLANDQDVDGDLLTLAAVDAPAHGTAVLAGSGAVTYAPAPDFHGTDTFTYAVVDPTGAAATATVTVTVLAVNDAPVARDDEGWTLEDTGTGLDLLANDDDVDDNLVAESLAVLTDPAHGVAVVDEDTLLVMYTPEPDYSGVDGFTYQICDEELVCTSASVSVLIEAVNDAPAAADDLATTAEDAPLAIDVLANDTDVDGEELTVAAVASPAHGEAVLGPDGRITYTPDRDFHGTDTFEYTVADEAGLTDTATVTVTVSPVDDAPEAAADGYDAPEDTLLTVPAPGVLANDLDADDDTLAALLVQAPAHGVLTLAANGAFTYLPEPDFAGIDTFTYQASDGDLTSAPVLVTITVAPVNDAPQILDHGFTVEEDGLLLVETPGVLTGATDPEGDPLAARVVVGPAHGALELNPDGSFTYVPDADWAGADLFTYQATDGLLESRVATVAIAVAEVNDAPVAGDDTALTEAGVAVTLAVLANDRDVDGDPLSLVAAGAGALGTVTIGEAGLLTYLPPAGFIGDDAFSYTVSDGRGGLATAQVVVTVTGGGGDLRVSVDIHPTSCPNPINIGKKGVVPAAVLGAVGFDVTRIDPTSVQLVSLAPSRSALEDVTTPYVPFTGTGGAYECTTAGSDGQRDLTLKFDSLKLATAIDQWLGRPAANGEVLVLPLTGNLKAEFGGTPFSGADVVKILR